MDCIFCFPVHVVFWHSLTIGLSHSGLVSVINAPAVLEQLLQCQQVFIILAKRQLLKDKMWSQTGASQQREVQSYALHLGGPAAGRRELKVAVEQVLLLLALLRSCGEAALPLESHTALSLAN